MWLQNGGMGGSAKMAKKLVPRGCLGVTLGLPRGYWEQFAIANDYHPPRA